MKWMILSFVEVKNYGENFKKNLLIPLAVPIADDSEYVRFSIAYNSFRRVIKPIYMINAFIAPYYTTTIFCVR